MAAAAILPPLVLELRAKAGEALAQMKEVGAEAKNLGKEAETGSGKAKAAFNGLAGAGKAVAMGVAGAAIAVGVEGLKMASEMSESDAKIAGAAQLPIAAATRIGDAFLETAGKSTFSGKEMADSFGPVAGVVQQLAGHALTAADSMKFMSAATDLAEASGQPLNTTTQALASTMQAYGLNLKDAADASNTMFNTSRLTGTAIADLATTATKLHGRLGVAAPDLKTTGALMLDLAQHGISGSRGVMVVQTAFTTLLGGGKAVNGELSKLGVSVYDASGKFVGMQSVLGQLAPKLQGMTEAQQQATLATLFGKSAATAMASTVMAGAGAFAKATTAVSAHDAVQKAAEASSNSLGGQVKKLKAGFGDIVTLLGEKLVPIITKTVDWLAKHKIVVEVLAGVIGGVMLLAMGAWIVSLFTAGGALAFLMSPVTLVVAAIGLLALGIYEAYKHFKPFRDAVDAIGRALRVVWDDVLKPVVDFFTRHWKAALEIAVAVVAPFIALPIIIATHWRQILDFFEALPGKILGFLADAGKWLLKIGGDILQGLLDGIEGYAHLLWDFYVVLPTKILGYLVKAGSWLIGVGGDLIRGLWNGITNIASNLWGWFSGLPRMILGLLGDATQWLFNLGGDIVRGIINGIEHLAGSIGGALKNVVKNAVGGLGHLAGSVMGFLGFDTGGLVPGPVGAAMPAVVHGGEYVLSHAMLTGSAPIDPSVVGAVMGNATTNKSGASALSAGANYGPPAVGGGSGGSGGSQVLDNHIHVYLDGKQIGTSVQRQQLQTGLRRGGANTYQAFHK